MNKPEFYPYVLLPEEIEKIKIEGIPVPELRDLPEFPEKPKKRFLGTIILIVSIGIMILLGSTHIIKSSFYSNTLTYLAFFISLVSLTATVFEIMHNSKAKKQYRIAVKLYNELKAEREQIKEERRKAIEDNNNQKAIDAYRHSAINTYFKYSYNKIQIGQREYSPAQKRFLIFLEQYFEGKILENARITHELKEIDYAPDFILKLDNPKVNIAIDIEAPYTFDGKKIVVKKNHSEEAYKLRYKVTNELRWVCIVFNEEQVVTQPTESCKLIAHAIDEILLKEKYSEQFKSISKIKRAEIPGQRELSAYIRNKYRENYLLSAGLIDETDFASFEVEIRKNGSDEPEKIIKTIPEQQTDEGKDKNLNDLKDKKSIIDTNGKSKSIIIEKKEEENNDIEQLEIAKKAAEKFKTDKKETETTQKTEEKDTQKSKIIDLNKKKQNVKEELLKSIEAKLEEEKKSTSTKRISLKKEAEKLNLLYSKSKTDKEKRKEEKEHLEKVKQEKEHLAEKAKKEKQLKEQELSLTEKAKQKRDEIYKERIAKEKAERERLEKERQEKVNAEKERIIKDKTEKERLEKERLTKEKLEKQPTTKEKVEKDSIEKEQKKKEAAEKLKIDKQKAEKERLEKERQEKLRIEKEQLIKEKAEKEKLKQEQITKEKAEKEQLEKKRKEQELAKKVALEKERIEKMQKELEEKEKIEARNRLMEKYKKQIEVLVSNKQWDMLFDACNEAIKEFPYWEWPYYRRSTMHGNRGHFIDAIEDCNKALSINPKLTDAVYNRATANFYLQRYEEALEDYQKCIDLNYKNSAEAYFNKGLCFQNLNHPKKAYREFVKAKNLGSIKAIEILNSKY